MSEQWKDDLEAVVDTIESLRNELAAARAQVEKEALEMGGVIHDLRRELARTIDSFLVTQARAQAAEARAEECEMIITAMTQWLDQQQPDVFRRGLWDAIAEGKK